MIKKKNHQYWDVNNLCGWALLQGLQVNNFEWIKDTSQFNEDFIKKYNEESDEGHFLEVSVQKKAKDTKKCVMKGKLKFENYNNCLEVTQLDNKIKC